MSQAATPLMPLPLSEQRMLITRALRLTESIAAKLGRRCADLIPEDELEAAGAAALAEAWQTFDPSMGVAFTTYAMNRVQGAMIDRIRVEQRHRAPFIALGAHRVTSDYLADHPDLPDDPNNFAWHRRSEEFAGGLAAAVVANMVADVLNAQDGTEEAFARRQAFARMVNVLQEARVELIEREREILDLHYGQGIRLREVASHMGIAYSTAKRIHASMLGNLAKKLRERGVRSMADTGIAG